MLNSDIVSNYILHKIYLDNDFKRLYTSLPPTYLFESYIGV